MSGKNSLMIVAAIASSFTALVVMVLGMLLSGIISFPLAMLICVALVGLYLGFGVLALVARFVNTLE